MLSAAKLGVKVADLDNTVTDVDDIREFLRHAKCKMIVFQPATEDADYLNLLRKAIPEFYECQNYLRDIFCVDGRSLCR
jgi:hypothetical protein